MAPSDDHNCDVPPDAEDQATHYNPAPPPPTDDSEGTNYTPATAPDPERTHYTPRDPAAMQFTASAMDPGRRGPPRCFGNYELLEEIARGGMGVVYKARQVSPPRLVALKMILKGQFAEADDLERFRIEARAAAALDHPGIVPIFEIGEIEGRPFFTMPLVCGGSLKGLLAQGPLPPASAAQLVQKVAQAVQYAHERGVIHRDIKPQNILLQRDDASVTPGPDGSTPTTETSLESRSLPSPRLTDFGLARLVEQGGGLTATGEAMGTPEYMPPEQAAGQLACIGPRSDVYSLGAVLYCLVTGRPPFQSATVHETLRQVRQDEPVSPRRLNAAVPRDLETVCLKCLSKEPERRYATASALAEELGRFLAGVPVVARPVGQLERGWKWMRRNPAGAGAVAALLLGTAASSYFGIDASRQARQARVNEKAAKQNEADAVAARNDLAKANQSLTHSRDALEATLARSLVRPLALLGGNQRMAAAEWEALWELATDRSGRLGYRFVEEASRTPTTSRQLRDRAALALHAVVGLDARRRDAVEALLLARLDDPTLADEQNADLALAAAAWEGLGASGSGQVAAALVQALKGTKDSNTLAELAKGLSAVVSRMDPPEAATLTQAIRDSKDGPALYWLAEGLSSVAGRLEPKEAAHAAAALTQAIKDAKHPGALHTLGKGLSAVAAHLRPTEAAHAAAALAQAIRDTNDPGILWTLAEGLSAVAARVEPTEAAHAAAAPAAATLTRALEDAKTPYAQFQLAQGLSAVTARLEPAEAAASAGRACAALTRALKEAKDPATLSWLTQGLSAVAPCLGPTEAAQVAATLTRALRDAKNPNALPELARGLSAVAVRLEPEAAAEAATALTEAIKDTKSLGALGALVKGLSSVAGRLDRKEAARAAATLTQALRDTKDPNALRELAQGLSAVTARLGPTEAAAATAPAATTLTQAIKGAKDPDALATLAVGLSGLAVRLDPEEAARAADTLTQALRDAEDSHALSGLAQGLSVVAARLKPPEAARVAAALTQAIRDTKDPGTLFSLTQYLSAVAACMGPTEAAQATAILTQAIKDTKDPGTLRSLAEGLSAVAARLGPKEAAEAAATLTQALKDTKDPYASQALAQGLSAVAARLKPPEAAAALAPAAATLAQALRDAKDPRALEPLGNGLSAVAARLDPNEAARAAATLTQALRDAKDPNALAELAEGLSAVADRLGPKEAAQAAVALTRALRDAKDTNALPRLARGLSAVADRLGPKEAAEAVAHAAAQVLADGSPSRELASVLVALLSPPPPLQDPHRAAALIGAGPRHPLTALPVLIATAEPPLCRLSTPQLVELLKMPGCVGPSRRAVLDHLGNRYRRRFADVWEFVRFAQEHLPDIDLTTPPKLARK
jgi:hypothetical protein